MDRLTIASRVWIVSLPLYIVLVGAVVVLAVVYALRSGHGGGPESPVPYIAFTIAPALAAAAVTRITSSYVTRASNGAFHAGPIAVGIAAGFFAGAIANDAWGMRQVFVAAVLAACAGQLAGAVLGTFIPRRLSPAAAAGCTIVVGAIALLYGPM